MQILINATILSEHNTGLGVYTFQILERVCPLLKKENVKIDILCGNKNFLPEALRENAMEIAYGNFISRNRIIKKISKKPYDLIWSTTQHGVSKTKNKQIITIHDLTPLFYPAGRLHQTAYYKFLLPSVIKKCNKIITVSQNTKSDILKYYKKCCTADNVEVCYASIIAPQMNESLETNKVLEEYGLAGTKYFCITGIHYEYKNIQIVIKAYATNENLRHIKVVIIGNDNCKYGKHLKKLIKRSNLENSFVFTGFIDGSQKNILIKSSTACIYPSKYEGFGLPLLEAMALKVPVVAADSSSLPEVGGDAALYFDPDNYEELSQELLALEEDDVLKNEMIQRGENNLRRFDWQEISEHVKNIILEILKN